MDVCRLQVGSRQSPSVHSCCTPLSSSNSIAALDFYNITLKNASRFFQGSSLFRTSNLLFVAAAQTYDSCSPSKIIEEM